ncbi:MAG: O-antigen ligase protein [Aeromicrobium sp.]|jgi:hypothetical protein|nr:O-antigen ligase protein [Aeromicrobium sp.]
MSTIHSAPVRAALAPLAVSAGLTTTLVAVMLWGTSTTQIVAFVAIAVLVAAYVTALHPRIIFMGFAAVLGFVPYVHVPGTGIPLLLVLAVGVWVALLFLPDVRFRAGWPEAWLVVLAGVALLSVVATGVSKGSLVEYVAWLAATAVVIPIRHLPEGARRACIRAFVVSCGAAALVGIALVRLDPRGAFLSRLSFVGYNRVGNNVQLVPGRETNVVRLTGTFVEPNIAGLILAVGLLLAVAYLSGVRRVLLTVTIGVALLLTLSRASLGSIVVAVLVLIVFSGGRRRWALLGAALAAGLATLAIPTVRERLFNSFGPSDTGSLERSLAFHDFPQQLQGHWWWGLGWAREEFRDPVIGRTVNFVANAPLLTIYRGGLVLGGLCVLILLVIVLRSVVATQRTFPEAVLASGLIGLSVVALQLDFPVVIQPPATVAFSFLLGLALHRPPPEET